MVAPTDPTFTVILPFVGYMCDIAGSSKAQRAVLVEDAVRVPFPAPFSMVHSPVRVEGTLPTMDMRAAVTRFAGLCSSEDP